MPWTGRDNNAGGAVESGAGAPDGDGSGDGEPEGAGGEGCGTWPPGSNAAHDRTAAWCGHGVFAHNLAKVTALALA